LGNNWNLNPNVIEGLIMTKLLRFTGNVGGNIILTPWCRVLLEKLTAPQLVKKFPAIYATRKFSTAFTSAGHLFLS